ncbi:hypothetical protein ACFFNY_30125 [Paenibacillus hodogayensis]|uniref:Uncharacterized protein n=1 Tax=Paenibacillus hodogayensis TaxID=279208 RepID=A0ABV5W5K5_9BACL
MTIAVEWMEPYMLKNSLRASAILDLILCPESWLRYYSLEPRRPDGSTLATVDNGAGDVMFILFARQGVLVKGFDHESLLSPHAGDAYRVWPGIYDEVPAALFGLLDDEALERDEVTFCLWREQGASVWSKGEVRLPDGADDGSGFLLGTVRQTPDAYAKWAESYYEMPVSLEAVRQVYAGAPVTEALIHALHPARHAEEALRELETIERWTSHENA